MHPGPMSLSAGRAAPRPLWQRDDRHGMALGAMVWLLVVMMIVPEGFDYGSLDAGHGPAAGSGISRLLWLALLAMAVSLTVRRAALAWQLARQVNGHLFLLVALALASVLWSIDPALSARRLVRLVTIVAVAFAFVLMGWQPRRYQQVLRPILTWVLLGSLAFGLAFPALAIHQETSAELAGAWRGLANHKNGLGILASLGLIFWFHAGLTHEVPWLRAGAGGTVALACLVLSRSTTALASSLFVLALLLLMLRLPRSLRAWLPPMVTLLLALLTLYALALMDVIPGLATLLAPVTAFTAKDITLTGRTGIWAILYEHISARPWLGSGYAAYWTALPMPGTDSYEFVRRMQSFYPGTAHNGYLDVVNDLGLLGLAGLLGYMVSHVRQSLRLVRTDRAQGALWLAIFFQQAISNLSETHWFSVLSVDFVVMTLATMALARALLEVRLRAVFGEPARQGGA